MRARSMSLVSRLAAMALVGAFAGCGDDNPTKPPPAYTYPTLNSPQNVLEALVHAYAARDTVEYRTLYDPGYQGASQDLGDGTNVVLSYGDEMAHVAALRRSTRITRIDFSLGTPSSWTRLPSDDVGHPEWALIQLSGTQFRLQIEDNLAGTLIVSNPSASHTFRFQPAPPGSGATDTLWTLIQWSEVTPP